MMRPDHLLDVAVPGLLREAKTLADSEAATPDAIGKMNKRLSDIVKQVGNGISQLRQFIDGSNLALLSFIRPIQLAGVAAIRFDDESLPVFEVDWLR
jgi:hypothetical protein